MKSGEKGDDRGSLLKEKNISLVLESYGDIFSDFDPRPYSEKALSDDFLLECKKAVHDKKELGLELRLLVPKSKRNAVHELQIKKRLKNHFHKHFNEKLKERKKTIKEGILLFFIGVILIFISTLLYIKKGFLFNFLFVVFEPAGWFTIWTGFEKIFLAEKEKKADLEFYKKMANVTIHFYNY